MSRLSRVDAVAQHACAAALAVAPLAHAATTLTYCSTSAPEGFDIAPFELSNTIDAAGVTQYDQLTRG